MNALERLDSNVTVDVTVAFFDPPPGQGDSTKTLEKSGEDGIRTRGAVLPAHRFSKPALSATQPPLRKSKKLGQVRRRPFPMLGLIYEMIMARAVGCEQGGFSPGLPAL